MILFLEAITRELKRFPASCSEELVIHIRCINSREILYQYIRQLYFKRGV